MSVKRLLIAAGFAAALPIAAVAASGWGGPGDFGMGRMGPMHDEGLAILRNVQLTDTQKSQAHQLFQTERQQNRPLMEQAHALHKQITEALLSTAAINTAQLAQLSEQEQKLHAQIEGNHLNTLIQLRALLTQDQLAKAASMHQQLEALHAQERQLMGAPRESAPAHDGEP